MESKINTSGMTAEQIKIYNKFLDFCKFRNKVAIYLSISVLSIYYLFILLVGLAPEVLGYKLGPSAITLGIMWGLFIICICIITTGMYTFIANKYFDRDLQNIVKEMEENKMLDFIKDTK